jgi:hypothetical protein
MGGRSAGIRARRHLRVAGSAARAAAHPGSEDTTLLPRRHRFIPVAAICAALVALFASTPSQAAPKDKAAEKLYEQAMDEDYLNTDFDAAIDKLDKAAKTCGAKGCSKEVLGRVYVALGVVYGGGKNDMGQAKASFAKAFGIDPNAKPLEDFMTSELKKVFEDAKKAGPAPTPEPAGDDDDDDEGGGDFAWTPPKEGAVNTPLAIFIKVPDDIAASKVTLHYKPFGAGKWLSENLKRIKDGWGGIIPCKQLSTTGELELRILISDETGDLLGSAGTRRKPHSVQIKNKITGAQPALPGQRPPQKCATAADCPPDFPGCGPGEGDDDDDGGGRGDKGWGSTCEETKECRKGLICLNGSCEPGEGDDDDDDDDGGSDGEAKNYFFLGGGPDLMVIDSADDVCGVVDGEDGGFQQDLDNYFCFDGDGEFLGKPLEGKFNQVEGGLGVNSGVIYIGYNRVIWEGLEAGIRIGARFPGSPGIGDAQDRYDECVELNGEDACREPAASDFFPLHAELRIGWLFLREGLVRPFAFVGGGFAQVNAGVAVAVCDTVASDGSPVAAADHDDSCDNEVGPGGAQISAEKRDIEAFQITGLNFIGFGGGTILSFHDNFGMFVEVKAMFMVPTFGVVIAPSIGPVGMF